jgi:hypothetical protein
VLPFKIHTLHNWALTRYNEHTRCAKVLERILDRLGYDQEESVARLLAHHRRIAKRYMSVANATQDGLTPTTVTILR